MKFTFKNETLGSIELTDTFGSDQKIIDCARVSYNAGQNEQKSTTGLFIRNLLSQGHETPFEHCSMTYKIKCPIFVARQWVRHRLASMNELSLRYTAMNELEFYEPDVRYKNGDVVPEELQDNYLKAYALLRQKDVTFYQELLDLGVSREIARIHLPVSMLTTFYWTANLREIMHFLRLRLSIHAQLEIRMFAYAILESLKATFPETYGAFTNGFNPTEEEGYNDLVNIG